MITFPRTLDEASAASGEKRAGGIDVQERYRSGVSAGPLVDLSLLTDLKQVKWREDGGLQIGALVPLARLLKDQRFRQAYPGLAEAITSVATPQIRAVGTLGGNLLQSPRCLYYRQPEILCYRKGGADCPARLNAHLANLCFDTQPCIAPSPSTLGMALLAYDAALQFHGKPACSIDDELCLHNPPSASDRDASSSLLVQITLPPTRAKERGVYQRITRRVFADWPLVEVLIRLEIEEAVQFARVTVGGVAPTPLRLYHVEAILVGQPATKEVFEKAATASIQANSRTATGYKAHLLQACILDTLLTLQNLSQNASENSV